MSLAEALANKPLRIPWIAAVARRARGIVVHADFCRRYLEDMGCRTPVFVVPHPAVESPQALRQALREVPESEVETRNQLSYYSSRCVANDASPGGRVPVGDPNSPKDSASTVKRDSSNTRAATAEAKGRFTLQVASYTSRSEATARAARLKTLGLEARVVGAAKPFRVRSGRYATRAEATAAQSRLRARKITATITDIGADDR